MLKILLSFLLFFVIIFNVNSQNDNLSISEFTYNGLFYEILDPINKTVKVSVSLGYDIPEHIEIPSEVYFRAEKYNVTELGRVGPYAKSLIIPGSIIKIDSNAIPICETTGDGTEPALSEVIVHNDNPNYSSENGILFNKDKSILIYCPNSNPNEVDIPNSVKKIGTKAFPWNWDNIKIPSSVTEIADSAFLWTQFDSIHIPSSVEKIGIDAFLGRKHWTQEEDYFKTISVSPQNQHFYSKNGILYNKEQDSIICIPSGKYKDREYDINYIDIEDVTYSNDTTILIHYNNQTKSTFTIPSSVTYINNIYNPKFQKLIIPASVKYIGYISGEFTVEVDAQNSVYSSHNGNLYSKDNSTLIFLGSNSTCELHPSVKNIELSAFDFDDINHIYITDSVKEMPYSIIDYTNVTISPNNKHFKIVDGVLFNADMSILFSYPDDKTDSHYSIPETVKIIEEMAFSSAKHLRSVTIPNSVIIISNEAFNAYGKISNITIPNSVKEIGINAFPFEQTYIEIPNSVIHVDESCFRNENIIKINVHSNNPNYSSIDGVLFNKDKTRLIRFPGNSDISEYVIPNSITELTYNAFTSCKNLNKVTIPNSVTSICNSAFKSCHNLSSITIPNSVTSIGPSAFERCNNLTSITIPNSVTEIGPSAFSGCNNLTSITIPNSITSIEFDTFNDCSSLTSIIIPNSVTEIGECAFLNCSNLKTVTIMNPNTKISKNAFYGCNSVKIVKQPQSKKSTKSKKRR